MASFTEPLTAQVADRALRAACRLAIRRIDLNVEGLQYLPAAGPAIIAARHFHHFYDGCALVAIAPRPLKILVTLDWLQNPAGLHLMRTACRLARWPVVIRSDARDRRVGTVAARSQVLTATRECVGLLRAGQLLLVFPEGYPNIDPGFTPKTGNDAFLPFAPGFLRFASLAERSGVTRVPIVPVGLEYQRGHRWRLTVRFGPTATVSTRRDLQTQVRAIEEQVRQLSGLGHTASREDPVTGAAPSGVVLK